MEKHLRDCRLRPRAQNRHTPGEGLERKQESRALSPEQVSLVLESLREEKDTYVQHRTIVAIALLYVGGLKPESIIYLRKDQGLLLFEGSCVEIDTVESWHHQKQTEISLTQDGVSFLKSYNPSFEHICRSKENSDYVFSPEKDFGYRLSLDIFERELSKAVKKHSRKLGSGFTLFALRQ